MEFEEQTLETDMKQTVVLVLAIAVLSGCEQDRVGEEERVIDFEQTEIRDDGVTYEVDAVEPFSGIVIGAHPNGQKNSKASFVNGYQHGPQTMWYADGQKSFEGNFVNNLQDGLQTYWYENGQKSFEGNFVDGFQEGVQTEWYENGQKAYEGNYTGGLKEGLHTEWNSHGRLIRQWNFVNGQSESAGIYVNDISVAEFSLYIWNVFRFGDTSELDILVRPNTTVQIKLQLPRDEKSYTLFGVEEVRGWIDRLHPSDARSGDPGSDDYGPIWGGAHHLEKDDDLRFLVSCDELICRFSGTVAHNTLYLDEVEFQQDKDGELLLKRLVILSE